jgi:N-methylhydantoinase B
VLINKMGDRISFDFSGSGPQVEGNINMTLNATQCGVCYAMKALLDPDITNNQGVIEVMEMIAPKGTITNCTYPSAVALRANSSQRVVDVVMGALADVLPENVIGAANGSNTSAVFSGKCQRTGADYVYLETPRGGMGGRSDRDGKDGVQVDVTNTSNLPIEAIEMEYPLRIEEYGLVPDSGGAGQYRGDLGLKRVIHPVGHKCNFPGLASVSDIDHGAYLGARLDVAADSY